MNQRPTHLRRNHRLTINLNSVDYIALTALATEHGVSSSDYARQVILMRLGKRPALQQNCNKDAAHPPIATNT